MYKVSEKLLIDIKKSLSDLTKITTLKQFNKNKIKADKLVKLLEDEYYIE